MTIPRDPEWCNGVFASNARVNRACDRFALIGIAVFGLGLLAQMLLGIGGAQ